MLMYLSLSLCLSELSGFIIFRYNPETIIILPLSYFWNLNKLIIIQVPLIKY